MSQKVYTAVGIGLGLLLAIVALVSFMGRDDGGYWWLPIAIGGIILGGWWTIASMFVTRERR